MIFVDGVGLAPAGPSNPLAHLPTPTFRTLLGGPLTVEQVQSRNRVLLVPLDATLGVKGLPQSATGQTALFTGINGAEALGRHVSAFPGPRLRSMIHEHSLFRQAVRQGARVTFANAFTPGYLRQLATGARRPSVTTCAAQAARLPLRQMEELHQGQAVSWDICRDHFARAARQTLEVITAAEAGRHLARLAVDHELTVFETFITDLAGHRRWGLEVSDAVSRIDGLLQGTLEHLSEEVTLLITSDHGNVEDSSHKQHTLNPVPLLAVGPHARDFAGLRSLLEVTPAIISGLGAGA